MLCYITFFKQVIFILLWQIANALIVWTKNNNIKFNQKEQNSMPSYQVLWKWSETEKSITYILKSLYI